MHTQISVRRLQQRFQFVECQRPVHRQRAYDSQPNTFVNQPVEIRRYRFARLRLYSASILRAVGPRARSCGATEDLAMPLSSVVPGDPDTESDLHHAKSRSHKHFAQPGRRKQRASAQSHQAQSHHRNHSHRKSTRQSRPPRRTTAATFPAKSRMPRRGKTANVSKAADDDRRGEAKKKFSPRTREQF